MAKGYRPPSVALITLVTSPGLMRLDLRDLALRPGDRYEDSYPLETAPVVFGGVSYHVLLPDGVLVVVERVAGGFLVEVSFAARVYGPCSRCLSEAVLEVAVKQEEFVPTAKEEWEDSTISTFVDDFVVDVDGLAWEALVLALPAQILCSDSCKGLCAQCGQDLNQGACGCGEEQTDERWSKLKNLRLED